MLPLVRLPRRLVLARGKGVGVGGAGEEKGGGQRGEQEGFDDTHIIVLFRARDDNLNELLVQKINDTRKMYVSGTRWEGKAACRIAVSTWKVEVERDLQLVKEVLEGALKCPAQSE